MSLPVRADALNVDRLDPPEVTRLEATLERLAPLIKAHREDGTANVLTWDQLYEPLEPTQRAFLDAFRALDANALGATHHAFGQQPATDLAPVGPQHIIVDGKPSRLDPQFLPRDVLLATQRMIDAMERDLGVRLMVESGYRSPAYQLYLFLFYVPTHDYSIRETNRFVALPGYSEHGYPPRQAVDFMNHEGINGEGDPAAFEALPEYQWLSEHAEHFGFALSYPRDNPYNTAFEPWHWHYERR